MTRYSVSRHDEHRFLSSKLILQTGPCGVLGHAERAQYQLRVRLLRCSTHSNGARQSVSLVQGDTEGYGPDHHQGIRAARNWSLKHC